MKNIFVEIDPFTKKIAAFLTDDGLMKLQNLLMNNPNCGTVIPGSGGLRKVRFADPRKGKGKRGGLRVIYFHIPEINVIVLLDVYDKRTVASINENTKKSLRAVAQAIKQEMLD